MKIDLCNNYSLMWEMGGEMVIKTSKLRQDLYWATFSNSNVYKCHF